MKNYYYILLFSLFILINSAYSETITVINLHNSDSNEDENIVAIGDEEVVIIEDASSSEEILNTNLIQIENDDTEINENLDEFSDIWSKSEKENIIFLLEKINNNISSNTIKSNLIDFFIYGNQPPKNMSQEEFDKLRILALKKLGDIESAIIVMNSIVTYEKNKDIYDLIILEKSLTDYNLSALCGVINSNSNFTVNTFILKIKIFCSFLNNNLEEAEFYNTLLLENDDDEYFQALYNKLTGLDNSMSNIQQYNYDNNSFTLYSAMMRSIDMPFTKDFVGLDSPKLMKAIAISPSTNISIRIEAAQKAYNVGILSDESIAAIYQSVDFSKDELLNPLNTIEKNYLDDPFKAMALLFQSSRIQILPISRLESLNNFWNYAKNINQIKLAYDLSRDLLQSIDPSSELSDFALDTAKAHLYNDNIEESKEWLRLIEIKSNLDEDKSIDKNYLQVIFLMSLKENVYEINNDLFDKFINNIEIEKKDINNLELYLFTLDYIGFEIPQNLWKITATKVEDNRTVPSIYMIRLLKESSSNNLLGELVLNITTSLEDKSWLEIHPQHLGIIFDSLKETNQNEILNELSLEILEAIG